MVYPRRPGSKKAPTLAHVLKLPTLSEFVARPASGDVTRVVFKPAETVFVKHEEMSHQNPEPHDYYKMRIDSLHQGHAVVWAVGSWFYTPDELLQIELSEDDKALVTRTGNAELIGSDHLAFIDAGSIEAHLNLHVFDDLKMTGPPITPRSWYTRMNLTFAGHDGPVLNGFNLQCKCGKLYSPVLDAQRYCQDCNKWFHTRCMSAARSIELGSKQDPSILLTDMPIMRGWNNLVEDQLRSWSIVGNGNLHKRVLELVGNLRDENKDVEVQWAEWKKELGEEYVAYVRDHKFKGYYCPNCQGTTV